MTNQAHGSAADTGLPSRRALVAALAAVPALSLPATAAGSMLSSLIAAHRRAAAAHLAAINAEEAIESDGHDKLLEIPMRQGRINVEPDKLSRPEVEQRIRDSYRRARDFASHSAGLDTGEAEDLANVRVAFDSYEARPSVRAMADAHARTVRASDEEDAAMLAICSHRCSTLDEARQKAEHLIGPGGWKYEEPLQSHVVALLRSFMPEGAANV